MVKAPDSSSGYESSKGSIPFGFNSFFAQVVVKSLVWDLHFFQRNGCNSQWFDHSGTIRMHQCRNDMNNSMHDASSHIFMFVIDLLSQSGFSRGDHFALKN